MLFVKTKDNGENDLHTFCEREGIPHVLFNHFSKVAPVLESVVKGERTKDQVLALGTL